jgi:hypothetical protein
VPTCALSISQELHLQKGYGFVHFAFTPEGVAAAIKCCEDMHNATIDKVTYKCSISHRLKQSMGGGGHSSDAAQEDMYPEYAYSPMMMFNPLSMSQYPFGFAYNPAAGMLVPVPVPLTMGMAAGLGEYSYPSPYSGIHAQQGAASAGGAAMLGMAAGGVSMGYPYSAGYSQPYPQAFPQVASLLAYQQQMQHQHQHLQVQHHQAQQSGYSTGGTSAFPYNNWYAPHSSSISDPSQTDSDAGIAYEDTQYHAVPHSATGGTAMNAAAVAAAVHGDSPYMYTTLPNGSYASAADGSGGGYQPYSNCSLEVPQVYAHAMANGTIPAAALGGGVSHPQHTSGHGSGGGGKISGGNNGYNKGRGGSWASLFSNNPAAQSGRNSASHANAVHPKSRETRSHLVQNSHVPAAPTLMAFLPAALAAGATAGAAASRTLTGHVQGGAVKTGQASARAYAQGSNLHQHHTGEGSVVSIIRNRGKAARAAGITTSVRPRGPESLDAEVEVVSPAADPDAHSATQGAIAGLCTAPEAEAALPDIASPVASGSSEATAIDSASRAANLPPAIPAALPVAPVNARLSTSAVSKRDKDEVLV